jgi:uncharacterized protein YdbL (DUF1318 family)
MMHRSSIVIILALLVAAPASAVNLGAAKTNGQVCEQTSGYLRANAGAPGDIQEMVNNINAKRRAEYEKIAQKNQVAVDQVAKLTAEKVINLAPQHRCK